MKILLISLLVVCSGCTSVFYHPSRDTYFEPTDKLGLNVENIYFSSENGPKIHAWFIQSKTKPAKGTVMQFHGNAENMTSHFLSTIWVTQHGYNLFTFDYRGYGKSEGDPYPAGVLLDSLQAFEKVFELTKSKEHEVIVYAQSLGSIIALDALTHLLDYRPIRSVVIEGGFLSYRKIARKKMAGSWLTWPFQWLPYVLVSDRHSPKKSMNKLSDIPLLSLHSERDPIIPIDHGKNVYRAKRGAKCFWSVPEQGHTNLMNIEKGKYREPMLKFLDTQKCPN